MKNSVLFFTCLRGLCQRSNSRHVRKCVADFEKGIMCALLGKATQEICDCILSFDLAGEKCAVLT